LRSVSHSRHEVTPPRFRSLMSSFPSGVSIVTALDEDRAPWGMTCSALCSVTVDPPTLLVGIRAESPTLRAATRSGLFTVNLLHARGRQTAELFASGDPERFRLIPWRLPEGDGGPHLTEAAHTVADCRVTRTVEVGKQRIVFGEVFRITEMAEPEPLLYGLRQYSSWEHDHKRS
jgi:flavin reductase (NADH)